MDGKGRWRDNAFVERIWKSIKYEEVYLHVECPANSVPEGLRQTGMVTRSGKLSRARLENSACVVRLVPVWRARLQLM